MKTESIGKIAWLVAAAAIGMGTSTSVSGALVNLATGNSGSINGANFEWTSSQATGTGVIDPFSQLQNNGSEASYNSSTDINPPFDQSGSLQTHNKDLLLASVPIVGGFYQFLLDINQNAGANSEGLLSLNQVMVYRQAAPGSGGGVDANGRLTGFGTPVYDMNSAGSPTANSVLLDASRNSGSGCTNASIFGVAVDLALG